MNQTLNIFERNLLDCKSTYIVDDFEGVAFRLTPHEESYIVSIKWKGRDEQSINRSEKIVADSLLGGHVISESEYNKY